MTDSAELRIRDMHIFGNCEQGYGITGDEGQEKLTVSDSYIQIGSKYGSVTDFGGGITTRNSSVLIKYFAKGCSVFAALRFCKIFKNLSI